MCIRDSSEDNEKAVCIIIYEVPVDVEAKVYTKLDARRNAAERKRRQRAKARCVTV